MSWGRWLRRLAPVAALSAATPAGPGGPDTDKLASPQRPWPAASRRRLARSRLESGHQPFSVALSLPAESPPTTTMPEVGSMKSSAFVPAFFDHVELAAGFLDLLSRCGGRGSP
jgi:hypothetical protein